MQAPFFFLFEASVPGRQARKSQRGGVYLSTTSRLRRDDHRKATNYRSVLHCTAARAAPGTALRGNHAERARAARAEAGLYDSARGPALAPPRTKPPQGTGSATLGRWTDRGPDPEAVPRVARNVTSRQRGLALHSNQTEETDPGITIVQMPARV